MKTLRPTLNALKILILLFLSLGNALAQEAIPHIPVIDGDFWRIGEAQDLDTLNGDPISKQHVVDHGFIKDMTGN